MLRPARRRAVQRALGVELEESHWEVIADPGVEIGKGTPVVDRPQFELQAEFGGGTRTNLEIVTKAPGVDEASFPTMLANMKQLITELDARQAGGPFKATLLAGGIAGYTIKPGPNPFTPFTQVTVGVPLAAVPAFFDELKDTGAAALNAPDARSRKNVADTLRHDLELEQAPSGKLLGLITLLGHYMLEGRSTSTFPKGSINALAKTDFAEIFMWLPSAERNAIRRHLDSWVAAIAGLGEAADKYARKGQPEPGYDAKKKSLLAESYYDPQADLPPSTIKTTREEWLKELVSTKDKQGEHKGRDIVSVKGKLAAPDTAEMVQKGYSGTEKEALKLGKDVAMTVGDKGEFPELRMVREGMLKSSDAKQRKVIEKLIADLKDLHAGLGALGAKHDKILYRGETGPGYSGGTKHRSVVLEIRRPMGGGWEQQAMNVFNALNTAIETQAPKVTKGRRFKSELPKPPQPAPPQITTVTQTVGKLASTAEEDLVKVLS
jgi:hypothetical protein